MCIKVRFVFESTYPNRVSMMYEISCGKNNLSCIDNEYFISEYGLHIFRGKLCIKVFLFKFSPACFFLQVCHCEKYYQFWLYIPQKILEDNILHEFLLCRLLMDKNVKPS